VVISCKILIFRVLFKYFDTYFADNQRFIFLSCTKLNYLTKFSEGLAVVRKDEKYGFINNQGALAIDCLYNDFSYNSTKFLDGLCLVHQGGKSLFINKLGEEVINCKSKINYRSFNNGLSYCSIHHDGQIRIFSSETKFGYMNKSGVEYWED